MKMLKNKIFIYTSLYPFSLMAESFLGEELRIGSRLGYDITVIPTKKDKIKRDLPENVTLDESLCSISFPYKIRALLRLLKIDYLKEIAYNKKRPINIRYYVDTIKYLYAAGLVYYDLSAKANIYNPSVFYSYWMSYAPIAFADYKNKHRETKHTFISRAHTFASFGTIVGVYYPMRDYVFKNTDKIFVISKILLSKLAELYPQYENKIQLSRLGVHDNLGEKRYRTNYIEIVSCSSVIPLKRVDLIFSSINSYAGKHSESQIRWTHIGDGPLLDNLNKEIELNKNCNLTVCLLGGIPNKDILELYSKKSFDAFVLLSIREGIPVVIMEAIASGIPVLATDVGGISDIVTNETGQLLKKDFTEEEFCNKLDYLLMNKTLSNSSHNFFLENFNSDINYSNFYNSLRNN